MSKNNIEYLRHSAAHLLAQAIYELFPDTIFTLGPATETGFFYDVFSETKKFKNEDLNIITERMKDIVRRDLKIDHFQVSKIEAEDLFKNNKFKLDIINTQIKEVSAGIAKQGDFIDLCKGGHVESTGLLNNFLLTGISGSYWRGNKEGDVLQRISGIIFTTEEELNNHLKEKEELEKYDHRRLGMDMELFSFHDEGPGFPFIHPKGMIILNEMQKYMRDIMKNNGYLEIRTPTVLSSCLWKQSGHYNHYKENMYGLKIDENEYFIKPMNCPGMFLVYNTRPRSYRELPLRLAEFGHVHRHELSGALHGLTRVRAFTQDDAHIFCSLNMIESEITNIIKLIEEMLIKTGLNNFDICLSTRPEKASGSIEIWNIAINALKISLQNLNKDFIVKEGDGAFYGPKIEFKVKDNFNREWTCGTIQLDFVQPENFDLNFINSDGEKERVVVIHQAIYGSLERFLAILLEHHKGRLPLWLCPVQVRVLSITNDSIEYVKEIENIINANNIRVEVDISGDPLNAKIQRSQKCKIPMVLIIGKKELENKTISIRYVAGEQKNNVKIEDFIKEINLNCE